MPTVPQLALWKGALPLLLLGLLAAWETWRPFFAVTPGRGRHALHNLAVAVTNTLVLLFTFGFAVRAMTRWAADSGWGLLPRLSWSPFATFAAALLVLDAWMYVWHRANHRIPLLWRFHRAHHTDRHMDVTTAVRFHLGEHVGAGLARLALVPLLGVGLWHLVAYDALVLGCTLFHHANISLGRWDRCVRAVFVSPDMHKVHHSDLREETDSNYATVLSVWDRVGRSFRMRPDPARIRFGLRAFPEPRWQDWGGLWMTPFAPDRAEADLRA